MIWRRGIVYSLLLMLLLGLSACASSDATSGKQADQQQTSGIWQEIQDAGKIVYGTAGTLYPTSYYPKDSEKLTGYNVEVMREVADRLGVSIAFKTMRFDAMLASLKSGRIDVITATPRKKSRESFAFSQPFKHSYSSMIVRADNYSGIHSLEDLKGKVAGGAATTVYSDIARKFGAKVKTYSNATNDVYLRDVANGRTDVIINDYYLQKLALAAFPELDLVIQPELKFYPTTVNVVMPEHSPVLKQKVNQALTAMAEDGTLTKLSKKFFNGADVSKKPDVDVRKIEGIE